MIREVDKSEQRIRNMFAAIAPRYDLMNHLLSLNIDRWWRRQTVKRLRFSGSAPVLDACTGTGDLAIAVARELNGSAKVVGTDFCAEMLDRARIKQQKLHMDGSVIVFVEADTQHLPYDDDTFQAVAVAFGLRNVSDTDAGLRELTRVCKPTGQVAVLEFSQPTLLGLRQAYSIYFKYVLPRIGQLFAQNHDGAYDYLPESVKQFPSGQKLVDRMIAAGLKDVTFTPMTFGVATLYIGAK